MTKKNDKYTIRIDFKQDAFKNDFPAYQSMLEVKEPLTYDRDTGKGKKNGLFDNKTFENYNFGKVTVPEELFGKMSIFTEEGEERVIEVIPVPAPRYRFDRETDVVSETYRKLILRRNRLRKLIDAKAPELVMESEIDLFLEAVVEVLNTTIDTFLLLADESMRKEFYNKLNDLGFLA